MFADVAADWSHGCDENYMMSSINSMTPAGSNIGEHYQKL